MMPGNREVSILQNQFLILFNKNMLEYLSFYYDKFVTN